MSLREGIQADYLRSEFVALSSHRGENDILQFACQKMNADGVVFEWLDREAAIEKVDTEVDFNYLSALASCLTDSSGPLTPLACYPNRFLTSRSIKPLVTAYGNAQR